MKANKIKLFVGILVGIIAILLIGVMCSRVTTIIGNVFAPIPRPPSAILQAQKKEQTAGVGTYCWDRSCGDFAAIITPQDALVVSSPVIATLKLSIDTPPSTLSISINPASKIEEFPGDSSIRAWKLYPRNYDDLSPKQEQIVNLELEQGLYVIVIFAQWAQRGDAMYGFLIDVK